MKGRRPSAGVAGRDTIDVDSSEESGTNTASAAATTSSTAARDSVSQRKVCGNHVHGNVDCEGREGAHDACPVERGEGDAMRWEGGNEIRKQASGDNDNEADTLRSRYLPEYIDSGKNGREASTAIASDSYVL